MVSVLVLYFMFVTFALLFGLMMFKLVYFVWCTFMGLIHMQLK